MYKMANAGHIGSSLSCLDILVDLFFKRSIREDKIILSKGHAACALYVVLAKSGRIPEELLQTFYKEGTNLAAHPPCNGSIPDIAFGTGSLGHGLSLATGFAFSQRFTQKQYHVYCLLSDGDCNEGPTWEAAMFAAHHKLSNLTVIIDNNGLQGFGPSADVINMDPLGEKWSSFGFDVAEAADGNDFGQLDDAFKKLAGSTRPKCLIAHTVKGKRVSYMENKVEWHYWPMNDEQYAQALKENKLK